jgi:hypothetical protein
LIRSGTSKIYLLFQSFEIKISELLISLEKPYVFILFTGSEGNKMHQMYGLVFWEKLVQHVEEGAEDLRGA